MAAPGKFEVKLLLQMPSGETVEVGMFDVGVDFRSTVPPKLDLAAWDMSVTIPPGLAESVAERLGAHIRRVGAR